MEIRKIAESGGKMTLAWDAIPGASAGYRGRAEGVEKWTQTQQTQMVFAKDAKVEIQALGIEDKGVYPSAAPPSTDYTYRFAAFDPTFAQDQVTGAINRFNDPAMNWWWVPGMGEPPAGATQWPNGGGVWPISTPHGPGFKLKVVPGMTYPGDGHQTNVARFYSTPGDDPPFSGGMPYLGSTHIWEWTWLRPSGYSWPSGVLLEGMWFGHHVGGSPSVGSHFYMDNGWQQVGPFHYYAARQTSLSGWERFHCPIPFNIGEHHHIRWESKWSQGGDGYMKASTAVGSGAAQQWLDYQGPTLPAGFTDIYQIAHGFRPPLNTTLELHWINQRVKIT
jgi:hypothetical protein